MGWLKSEYKSAGKFFKENLRLRFFLLLIGFVLIGIATHYMFLAAFAEDSSLISKAYSALMEAIKGIDIQNDPNFVSFIKLFFNNARVCLIATVIGIIPFLFLPVFIYLTNGTIIGMLSALMTALGTFKLSFFLASIVPHGIFEVPAIIYSCALGMYLCKEVIRKIFGKSDKPLRSTLLEIFRSYCLIVLPLLLIAAFIEAFVTMRIAMMFV